MSFLNLPLILALMVLAVSCSPRSTTPPALPGNWYQQPEEGSRSEASPAQPGPEFDSRVVATFQAHTSALDGVPESASLVDEASGGLKNWTPWHLDGMVANFTIGVGGVFAALVGEGSASIKGIWKQKQEKPAENQSSLKLKRPAAVKFNAKMTAKDVPGLMEPLVKAATATHSVADPDRMRRNLNRKGQEFLRMARYLSRVENRRVWKVEGFELQLTFDARGQVTPSIAVGGTFSVYLEWEREDENGFTESLAEIDDSPIYRNLNAFTDLMASMIPEFRAESETIRRYGFDFTEFQVGIGVIAGGDIAIAALAGSISGTLKFRKAGTRDRDFVEPQELPEPPATVPLKLIGPALDSERTAFVAAHGIQVSQVSGLWGFDDGAVIYDLARSRFREGVRQAANMGTYFASRARSADSSRWGIDHLEVQFSAGITGDLKVVTVGGQGSVTLGFDKL